MKERLDILLTQKGLCDSRSRAKALIMEGAVFVDGIREDKPGSTFDSEAIIELRDNPIPFVSRGGLKLDKAIKEFGINLFGKVAMDVGASTGGFTDCMLQNGAKKVYSVDVGYGQLDYKLRIDDRVVVMERTNIRKVVPGDLEELPEFSSIDVSFISLKTVLPVVKSLMATEHEIVALIKPQFEAGKEQVGKNGVVRDEKIHRQVIKDVCSFAAEIGYLVKKISFSPIKGPKGNIEYLMYIHPSETPGSVSDEIIEQLVEISHSELKG